MFKLNFAYQKIVFIVLLVILNIVGIIFVGIVFLGASNANGEGAPVESELRGFLGMLAYVLFVSISVSAFALVLARIFREKIHLKRPFLKYIFWTQFSFLVLIFLITYLFLSIRFA